MSSIAVEPSTKGQYGDNDQNLGFCPSIGFQSTPLHLVFGLTSRTIQYNSVNEEDIMWKGIGHSGKLKGILLNMGFILKINQPYPNITGKYLGHIWHSMGKSYTGFRVRNKI